MIESDETGFTDLFILQQIIFLCYLVSVAQALIVSRNGSWNMIQLKSISLFCEKKQDIRGLLSNFHKKKM